MINDAPNGNITPLIEVVNQNNLRHFYKRLNGKYDEVWVDLPYYLTEESNYFQTQVTQLSSSYLSNQADFFTDNINYLDVPVVSAPDSYSYDPELNIYNSIKGDFDKIAVRIRAPVVDIKSSTKRLKSYKKLVKSMRPDDVLLLDVFRFLGVESQVVSNIGELNKIAQNNNIGNYILNAFETNEINCHNYGPLLTRYFSSIGYGDFATDERYKATGGGGSLTRTIRYYEPSSYTLWFFTATSGGYPNAKNMLTNSGYWANTSTTNHRTNCIVCEEVNNDLYSRDHKYWKRFKMLHYLCSTVDETSTQYSSAPTTEDLDPDGYNKIVKS